MKRKKSAEGGRKNLEGKREEAGSSVKEK